MDQIDSWSTFFPDLHYTRMFHSKYNLEKIKHCQFSRILKKKCFPWQPMVSNIKYLSLGSFIVKAEICILQWFIPYIFAYLLLVLKKIIYKKILHNGKLWTLKLEPPWTLVLSFLQDIKWYKCIPYQIKLHFHSWFWRILFIKCSCSLQPM